MSVEGSIGLVHFYLLVQLLDQLLKFLHLLVRSTRAFSAIVGIAVGTLSGLALQLIKFHLQNVTGQSVLFTSLFATILSQAVGEGKLEVTVYYKS